MPINFPNIENHIPYNGTPVTTCPESRMGTKKISPEDLDGKKNEEGRCVEVKNVPKAVNIGRVWNISPHTLANAEAGKTVLGNTTFHSLPWLAENVSSIIKVNRQEFRTSSYKSDEQWSC
jgi:hypothetical protein